MISPLVMFVSVCMVRIALNLSNSLPTRLKIDSRRVGRIRACRKAALKGGNMEQGVHTDQTAEPLLAFTAKAVEMIRHAMRLKGLRDGGIRMTVAGGGCKGFQYSLNLERTAQADDTVVVQDGIKAFLDPNSAQHLQGTRLDYVTNRQGTGFHFFGMESSRTIGCRSTVLLRWCIENNTRTEGCIQCAKRPLMDIDLEAATQFVDSRQSISHPGLRPMQLCEKCHYVICQCDN